ncbi:MAG: hypothetical protein SGI90_01635 [Candidatus Eisenbacteria bacterium]|nr:hypothetical protein [Candidatus Eisenbacteria bacterium]
MTPESEELDLATVHRQLSTTCFNHTWQWIDKADRTSGETEEMIHGAHASAWHWLQRPDNTPKRRSVGCWLLSRVYALAGRTGEARHYANLSALAAMGESPFYRAYALEALARAEHRAGNDADARRLASEARELAESVEKPEDRKLLLDDLETLPR